MNPIEKVVLRLIEEADTDNIIKWRNSDAVKKNLYSQSLLTNEQHLTWLKTKVATGDCYQFIIEVHSLNVVRPIGTIFIKNIDRVNSKGEYGIFIGESDCRGKGYALPATKNILEFAFNTLKLNRVYLTVFSDNYAAIKVYEKASFSCEGILKQDFLRCDGYIDVVCMGITADVWNK